MKGESTAEYGNTQIISTDYTEAFHNFFNRNYKLITFNIFMRILIPAPKCYWVQNYASSAVFSQVSQHFRYCPRRYWNTLCDFLGEAERYLKGLWVSAISSTYFYSTTAVTWMKILGQVRRLSSTFGQNLK